MLESRGKREELRLLSLDTYLVFKTVNKTPTNKLSDCDRY